MVRTKREPTDWDKARSREVLDEFGNVALSQAPPNTHREIIRTRYGETLKGIPLERIPDSQAYIVARRIMGDAQRVASFLDEEQNYGEQIPLDYAMEDNGQLLLNFS